MYLSLNDKCIEYCIYNINLDDIMGYIIMSHPRAIPLLVGGCMCSQWQLSFRKPRAFSHLMKSRDGNYSKQDLGQAVIEQIPRLNPMHRTSSL